MNKGPVELALLLNVLFKKGEFIAFLVLYSELLFSFCETKSVSWIEGEDE